MLVLPQPGLSKSKSDPAAPKTAQGGTQKQNNDITVHDTVKAAFSYNPGLQASQESRIGALHSVERARAGFFPSVVASAGGGVSQRNDSVSRQYNEENDVLATADASLRLTQSIWSGGATTADVSSKRAQLESAGELLEDKASSLAFDAIVAHTEVLRRRALVRLAENNVKEHEKILGTVRQRYQQTMATAGELSQVESRLYRAQATLYANQSALETAEAGYQRVTGKRAPSDMAATPLPPQRYPNLNAAREACFAGNPRIRATLANLRGNMSEKDLAKSRFYPQVDLEAGPSWRDKDSEYDYRDSGWDAMLRLRWDLYSGGADTASVKMSSAKIRETKQNLQSLMDTLNEDIQATYSTQISAIRQEVEYSKAKAASRRSREDYYRQFLSAQRGILDVLDAESDFFYAASQQVITQGDVSISGYRLLTLGGALLPLFNIDPADLRSDTPTTSEDPADYRRPDRSNLNRPNGTNELDNASEKAGQ